MFRICSVTLHGLCHTIYKTPDRFINCTCGKLSNIFSWCDFSFRNNFGQKLFWTADEGFKIASYVAPQTRYLYGIQIWRVIRWPLFLCNHLQTVLVDDLLSAQYLLNLSLAVVGALLDESN